MQSDIAVGYIAMGIDRVIMEKAIRRSSGADLVDSQIWSQARLAYIGVYDKIPWSCYQPAPAHFGQRPANDAVIRSIITSYEKSSGSVIVSDAMTHVFQLTYPVKGR